ncbi:MAG: ABC transporter ATP-binding protein/permease [Lachnospiraceae bacterium]|nr:ABC transporter ATP-binding protein/permease [Lachnospiraceae bacterium]
MKSESVTKPHYGILRNVAWMIRIAWRVRKRVLVICVLTAVFEILYNLAQLYIAPEILELVEQHASMESLILTILFFTAALFVTQGIKQYFSTGAVYARVDVRTEIVGMLADKSNTTSFPNTLDADFMKLREKADDATGSNASATEYIWQGLTNLLKNAGGFLVCLTILSSLTPVLTLVIIATCAAGFLVSRYSDNWEYEHRKEESEYYTKKKYIRDKSQSVVLAKDIRIFGLQDWLNDLLDSVHDLYLTWRLKVEKKRLAAGLTEAALTLARNGIAYVYLINLALNENLPVSKFVLYFTAVSTFSNWVMEILKDLIRLHKDSLDICSVREFLEYPEPFRFEGGEPVPNLSTAMSADSCVHAQEEKLSGEREGMRPPGQEKSQASDREKGESSRKAAYELELEHVSFRYPGARSDTIHDVCLVIRPGEKLAVVGLNGAGKTTLVRLLCGLFDPTEGRVLLNGKDIRTFDRREYYRLFSAVFQEYSVLDVTVAENVAQTTKDIDYDRVRDCLDKAGLTKTIEELPNGINTHVGRDVFLDGVLFSGGQTQRLMLARALYKNGPILVLDEPTAALDPIAENDIYMKYNDMTKDKTSVFISHRLASTRFCDRIIFVADGRIAEEGTHESLLALGGEYAKLFEIQSRYYDDTNSGHSVDVCLALTGTVEETGSRDVGARST